jgi:hypothetical protein
VSGLCVFALAGETCKPFESSGHLVEFVKCGDLYAAVERAERAPVVSEQALRSQHGVIAELSARVDALLPVRFGAFVEAGELESIVSRRQEVIADALRLVRGRSQMTVRLLREDAQRGTATLQPATRPQSGTDYLEGRRQLRAVLPSSLAAVSGAVRGLVVTERCEVGRGGLSFMLYHLVDREDVQRYRDCAAAVKEPADGTLTVTGPWAPFAFAPDLWT